MGTAPSGTTTGTAPSSVQWTTSMSAVPQIAMGDCSLYVDYVYLDTDERRRFAQVSHEYLIEQLQYTGEESTNTTKNNIKLNFNHPSKELIWVIQPDDLTSPTQQVYGAQWFNYTDNYDLSYTSAAHWAASSTALINTLGNYTSNNAMTGFGPGGSNVFDNFGSVNIGGGGANAVFTPVSYENGANPTSYAKLQLNGHDRFSERDGRYFNLVQPYQHHENVPSTGINVYSFALKPEEHQPSGTCNFSRIDSAVLNVTVTKNTVYTPSNNTGSVSGSQRTAKVRIYCINYNVLRIMSGMGEEKKAAHNSQLPNRLQLKPKCENSMKSCIYNRVASIMCM